ncbi:MAG: hypothetical protein ABL957_14500 [Parvularculaceae bacterium]
MMTAAGGAALPPARDLRVLLGATTFFGAWLGTLFLQRAFQDWNITSAFFILDIGYCTLFYLLSRPSPKTVGGSVYERNWAGDVFFVFAAIVILELAHFAEFYAPQPVGTLILSLIIVFAFVVAIGFWRGFGPLTALQFSVFAVGMAVATHLSYGASLNFLSAVVVAIITIRGARISHRNLRLWTARFRKPNDTPPQDELGRHPVR